MPFDEGFLAGESQTGVSLVMFAISLLSPEERGPAAAAYLADCMTEALVAMMFGIRPETLKKWRTDGNGPPRTTEGNIVLFPIPLLRSYLTERARGAHVSQRPLRR